MSNFSEIKCPNCGRTFAADATADELFCSYCGARFSLSADSRAHIKKEETERLLELFNKQEYAAIVRDTYDGIYETDHSAGMLRCAAQIFTGREDYLKLAHELLKKRNSYSVLRRFLTSHDEYTDSPIHNEWFKLSEKLCAELAQYAIECIASENSDEAMLARQLSLKVMRELLAKKTEKKQGSLYWPQVAIEHHTIPLIDCLELDDLSAIYSDYSSYYKKFERLPNQIKVLDAMNARFAQSK